MGCHITFVGLGGSCVSTLGTYISVGGGGESIRERWSM